MKNYFLKLFLFQFIIIQAGFAQKNNMTIEWLNSPEASNMTRLPSTSWFDNEHLLMLDWKDPNPTLMFYDINTEKKAALFNVEKASDALVSYLGDENTPKTISWPIDFSSQTNKGLYLFEDDIFLLDFKTSEFIRITSTTQKEKSIQFSPDGKKISYVRENNLFVYDIQNKRGIQLTFDGSETLLNGTLSWVYWEELYGRHDIGYWWSEDSKDIVYLQSDESNVSLMHYVDFKPAVPEVINQRYPKAGGENPVVKAGIVKLQTQKTIWIKIDTSSYEYLARVNWLPGSTQISVQTMNRAQTELNLYLVQSNDGSAKKILTETSDAWVNINDDLHFLENRKQFLWVSERDGYAHIYLYDVNGKMIRKITSGDWTLISAGGGVAWLRQAIVAVDEGQEWIYFTSLKHSNIERQLYRIHFDGTGLKQISKGAGTHSVTFNSKKTFYIDRYSGSKNPPGKYLNKSNGDKVRMVAGSNIEALTELGILYPEYFNISATDGFPLPAMILKPENFDAHKKYPLILSVYGGPSAPTVVDRWQGVSFDQVLLNNGFIVAKVDPRSATAISKKLENLILYNAWGDLEVRDLSDAVKWFKSQSFIDSSRVGIWGWSGGGTFTLTALTKTKEFKAGIAVAPVSDWRYYDSFYAEFAMKRPVDNPDGYEKTSRVKSAKDLHGRLLLVHGTYDDNVHLQNSWAFSNELIKNNIMFDMMIYPMRKHGISDKPARIHLYNTMLEFWNRYLKN